VPRPSEKYRGQFFWPVQLRRSEWRGLMASVEKQDTGMLMLWFVVRSGGARSSANDVGTAAVDGVEVLACG